MQCSLGRVRLFATPWTIVCQAPLSVEFSRQEYWSRLLFPNLGDLPDPGIEPMSPVLQHWQEISLPTESLGKPLSWLIIEIYFSFMGFPGGAVVRNSPASAGDAKDAGSIPGSRRSRGGGNGNPLQFSCLGNPKDRGAWQTTVHGITNSQTPLSTAQHFSFVTMKSQVGFGNDKCYCLHILRM